MTKYIDIDLHYFYSYLNCNIIIIIIYCMQSSTRLGDSQNRSRYPAKWMKLNDLPNILFPQVSKPKYLDENYQFKPDTSGDMKDGLP